MGNSYEQVKIFLDFLIGQYIEKRNIEGLDQYIDVNFSWIGVEGHQICNNIEDLVSYLNTKSIGKHGTLEIKDTKIEMINLTSTIVIAYGSIEIREYFEHNNIIDTNFKITAVCRNTEQGFKLRHFHISLPKSINEYDNNCKQITVEQGNKMLLERIEKKAKELEQITEEFIRNEARYKFAIEATNDIVFDYNVNTGKATVDFDKLINIYGLSRNTIESKGIKEAILEVVHSDYLEIAKKEFFDKNVKAKDINTLPREYKVKNGNSDYIWVSLATIPILSKSEELYKIVGHVKNIDSQKRREIEMRRISRRDSLTGLWNRSYTEQSIEEFLKQENSSGILLMIDIDNFKGVNDTFGHLFGDEVLVNVSTKLQCMFKDDSIVGRIGGDEFVVFIKNVIDVNYVVDKVAILMDFFRQSFEDGNKKCSISGTMGISIAPKDGDNYNELIKNADIALYNVKRNGKNSYMFYDKMSE